MKLKNILFPSILLLACTACDDYLNVDAPSKYGTEFVFGQKSEMKLALNNVYAKAITGNLYGNYYQSTFVLNSDVECKSNSSSSHAHNGYTRFDCDEDGSEIKNFWNSAYSLIQVANDFIYNTEHSAIYDPSDVQIMQWLGEAKCLRAMIYHDLVVMFGDVPFSFLPTEVRESFVIPVFDRQQIQDSIINDLKGIAPYMQATTSCTVERCSKEFAQGLIARIALTAGGYSLRPDKGNNSSYGKMERPANYKDYYEIARNYADSVISAGVHSLGASYQDVFVTECNYEMINNGDPIFELPFAKEASGNTGYSQGPQYKAYEGATVHAWGECNGGARLNAFYRYLFRENDVRREFVNGLWYYSYYTKSDGSLADSVYISSDYTVYNNKWSKLWTSESAALGADKSGNTGINFPYMRYADILLMYAEADNELNGAPTDKAKDCLAQVHNRAFLEGDADYLSAAGASKEAFQKAVLDERKWEFAGENSRWRDLVRTNNYAEELIYSFLRYYTAGIRNTGSSSGYEDMINAHDGYADGTGYIDNLPEAVYYHTYNIEEANAYALKMYRKQLYGYTIDGMMNILANYPNQTLQSLRIYNAYEPKTAPVKSAITKGGFLAPEWYKASFYQWGNQDTGLPKNECKNTFFGYVRCDDAGNLWLVENGALIPLPATIPSSDQLPVVRYILPYPNETIQASEGAYRNYYGYQK